MSACRFAAMFALATSACGMPMVISGDDGSGSNIGSGSQPIHVAWSIEDVDGSAAACAEGYDTIMANAIALDGSGGVIDNGAAITASFACSAGTGDVVVPVTGMVDATPISGVYVVELTQTTSDGSATFATDVATELNVPVQADVTAGPATASFTLYQDGGYAWVEWSLYGNTSQGFIEDCTTAGVDEVEIQLSDETSGAMVGDFTAPCAGYTGIDGEPIQSTDGVGGAIMPFLPGTYYVSATALANDEPDGSNTPMEDLVAVGPMNQAPIQPTSTTITVTSD